MRAAPRSPQEGADGPRPRWRERVGARWSAEAELAHAIHGIVVGSAVMVAASLHGTLVQVVVTVAVTLLVYWATERYAELLAAGARGTVPDRRSVATALGRGWPMLQSSYAPVVVLLVASVLGADLRGAVPVHGDARRARLQRGPPRTRRTGDGPRLGRGERPARRGDHRPEARAALTSCGPPCCGPPCCGSGPHLRGRAGPTPP